MALVSLKDVKVYATFSKGFRVVEESKGRDGKEYSTRWAVWLDTANVTEGDIVSVSGFLAAKVNEWSDKEGNTRHSVELALNSPRIGTGAATTAPPAAQQPIPAQEPEPWANGPQTGAQWPDTEAPF